MESIYEIKEVAKHVGLSKSALYENIKKGKIPAKRIGGRIYLTGRTVKKLQIRNKYKRYYSKSKPPTIRNDLLTATQASKELGCSRKHIYWLIRKGYLYPNFVGKNYLISFEEIERFKKEGKRIIKRPKKILPEGKIEPVDHELSMKLKKAGWVLVDEERQKVDLAQFGEIFGFLEEKGLENEAEILLYKFLGREKWLKAKYCKRENMPLILKDEDALIERIKPIIEDKNEDKSKRKLLAGFIERLCNKKIDLPDEIDWLNETKLDKIDLPDEIDWLNETKLDKFEEGYHIVKPDKLPPLKKIE